MAKIKPKFSQQAATAYVAERTGTARGLPEATCGLWHRTLPDLLGFREVRALTIVFAFARFGGIVIAACLPIFSKRVGEVRAVEKAAAVTSSSSSQAGSATASAASSGPSLTLSTKVFEVWSIPFDVLDVLLVVGALVLAIAPRVWSWYKSQSAEQSRSRALEALAGSIQGLPAPGAASGPADVTASCATALNGLKNEISRAIGDESGDLTDAVLLVFADDQCSTMLPLARTEQAESQSIGKILDASLLQAFYVAKVGQLFAEHDFGGQQSPFPSTRVTPSLANTPAHYRSVLFIPIVVRTEASAPGAHPVVRQGFKCVGVICVHSRYRYRFWKYGDHRVPQGRGEVTTSVVRKVAPYQQVIAHCLKTNYPQLQV